MPSLALRVQRGSVPGAPKAEESLSGFTGSNLKSKVQSPKLKIADESRVADVAKVVKGISRFATSMIAARQLVPVAEDSSDGYRRRFSARPALEGVQPGLPRLR